MPIIKTDIKEFGQEKDGSRRVTVTYTTNFGDEYVVREILLGKDDSAIVFANKFASTVEDKLAVREYAINKKAIMEGANPAAANFKYMSKIEALTTLKNELVEEELVAQDAMVKKQKPLNDVANFLAVI